ncbi:MAG: T9SS type A sorting domain-containing protein [Bacteroidales bacterium]|nr:T9SS type A sorting domain-containing protein [Bacteroidales bacterium]
MSFSDSSIDLTGLENGIYFIRIVIDNETINKKINLIK